LKLSTSPDHIDALIASYLAGEASTDEIAFISEWKEQSETNRRYFDQLKLIFEKTATVAIVEEFNTDKAWEKVRQKLPGRQRSLTIAPPESHYTYWRIAAGIVLFIAAGIFSYQFFQRQASMSVELLSDKRTAADTLPDGSGVFLNRETRVDYVFDSKKNTHTARLSGEAYFNIQHDEGKTFIVEAHGTFIKDIGTSFNVKAYPDSATIEVVVEEGEVMFYTEIDSGVYLKANGKGVYNKNTGKFTVAQPEPNVTAYKTKFFSFSNHSLGTVVRTLNEVYSTQIHIDPKLQDCKLTVSFNNETIDEIAQIIAETLGLTVAKDGKLIKLKGSGCGQTQP
jgi:transmembrane sensor